MRIGIMQPYFFPYLGHFALIAHTDSWIVFDITQYTPKRWMNRNCVLHPRGGPNWISVVLANKSIAIKSAEAKVADMASTGRSALGKISHYRRHAPYYEQVVDLLSKTFQRQANSDSLVHLNLAGLKAVCSYLELPFSPQICSDLHLDLPHQLKPGEWALEIADRLGADAYLNPAGGRAIFDSAAYASRGIKLEFLQMPPFEYSTGPWDFVPNLSILDVLMWNEPRRIRDVLTTTPLITS